MVIFLLSTIFTFFINLYPCVLVADERCTGFEEQRYKFLYLEVLIMVVREKKTAKNNCLKINRFCR